MKKIKYPITFKAAILEKSNKPLVIDEVVFEGPLKRGQILVKILYSGICGKQIEEIKATQGRDRFLPHMLGHEGSGRVEDIGPGVTKVKLGDYVVLHWVKAKGIDASTPIYKYRRNGKEVNAGWITTFNEYGIISENRMTVIPKTSDMKIAALLGCAATTGVGTVLNEAKVKSGESVAIFGCGGVGLSIVIGAKHAGAKPIVAVDKNRKSLLLAGKLGATNVICSNGKNPINRIKDATGGIGAKHVFICAPDPKIIETAVEASSLPGDVYFVSVPPAGSKIMIDPLAVHKHRRLLSCWGGSIMPERDIPAYLALFKKRRLKLEQLIANTITLEDINKGISELLSGAPGRCIVKMA
jgi:S-(hydroxymethyl)glutathione dehydrogenase/alcohol dehydrogenase